VQGTAREWLPLGYETVTLFLRPIVLSKQSLPIGWCTQLSKVPDSKSQLPHARLLLVLQLSSFAGILHWLMHALPEHAAVVFAGGAPQQTLLQQVVEQELPSQAHAAPTQ
jgi:hypothetical protein